MTEWLTENARRSYPLEREWPEALAAIWTPVLLDACIGYDGLPEDGRIRLLSVTRVGAAVDFRIGVSESSYLDIPVQVDDGPRSLAYSYNVHYKAFLVVSNAALTAAVNSVSDGWSATVDVPLALRCTNHANRFVSSIEAHSPTEPCARPVFGPGTENPVATMTGDVSLIVKNGLDLEVTTMAPLEGGLLRLTAVTAPSETRDADKPLDLMIRGDECIAVEALPGYGVTDDGDVVPLSDPTSGVIRLTEKCKPCCQCEDYEAATKALRPGERATFSAQNLLDAAKAEYDAAVALLDEIRGLALRKINDYDHVQVSAVAVTSGGITPEVTATGTRWRIAVNLTVMNLALEDVTVSAISFVVPSYLPVKVHWGTAGHAVRTGDSLTGKTWTLKPGDTLSVVATYSMSATTNTAVKPAGMTARLTRKLPSRDALTSTVEVL